MDLGGEGFAGKKKRRIVGVARSANFTKAEKELLSQLVERHKEILECKRSDAVMTKTKDDAWIKVTSEYNAQVTTGIPRLPEQLRNCWHAVKKTAKKKIADEKVQVMMTGGGTATPVVFDEAEQRAIAICQSQFFPMECNYDDDASNDGNQLQPTETTHQLVEIVDSQGCSTVQAIPIVSTVDEGAVIIAAVPTVQAIASCSSVGKGQTRSGVSKKGKGRAPTIMNSAPLMQIPEDIELMVNVDDMVTEISVPSTQMFSSDDRLPDIPGTAATTADPFTTGAAATTPGLLSVVRPPQRTPSSSRSGRTPPRPRQSPATKRNRLGQTSSSLSEMAASKKRLIDEEYRLMGIREARNKEIHDLTIQNLKEANNRAAELHNIQIKISQTELKIKQAQLRLLGVEETDE